MMISVLQIIGILYLLFMLYMTFLYYKRNHYSIRSFALWVVVWIFGILLLVFPQSSSIITQKLNVPRVIDFYIIIGLMFFSVISFFSLMTVKRNEKKIEELVRRIALQEKKRKK